jgi:hypothetical protein
MKARLSWSEGAPSEQGAGFKIYRSENDGDFTLRATLPLSTTTYDDDIQANVLYTYHVHEYLALWLEGWSYRRRITISGSSGAGTGYQVLLKIGESSGATGCDFHLDGKSANFPSGMNQGGDLRFTADDGTTLLSFWVEAVNGTSPNRVALVWVKISADLGTSKDVYIYFGNPNATNASNGTNTFLFFDDFDDGVLDWTTRNGSWSETNGYLEGIYTGTSTIARAKKSFNDSGNFRYKWRAKFTTNVSNYYPWCGLEIKSSSTDQDDYDSGYLLLSYTATGKSGAANIFKFFKATSGSLSLLTSWTTSIYDRTFYTWTAIYQSGTIYIYKDDSLLGSISDSTYSTGQVLRLFYSQNTGTADFDWIFVSKYVSPEPAFTSAEAIESSFAENVILSSCAEVALFVTQPYDSGACLDTAIGGVLQLGKQDADNGSGVDQTIFLSAALSRSDTGLGSEYAFGTRSTSTAEHGELEDSASATGFLQSLDTNSGFQELIPWLNASLSGSDLAEAEEIFAGTTASYGMDEGEADDENLVYAASYPQDNGTALEALFILLPRLDLASNLDSSRLGAFLFGEDSGQSEEIPVIAIPILDLGAGEELQDLQALLSALDSGLGAEFKQLLGSLSASDQGSGEEISSVNIYIVSLDLGLGAEISLLDVLLATLDQALGEEPASLKVNLIRLDTGLGEEPSATLIRPTWDTGEGHEATELSATLSWQDSGQGFDLSALLALLAHSDQGEGEEPAPFPYAFVLGLDVPSAEDEALVSALSLAAERGQGQDFTEFEGTTKELDQGTGQERKYFLFIRNPGSPWGWKIYELTGIPEPILQAVQAQGETGEPCGSKVTKPRAISRG